MNISLLHVLICFLINLNTYYMWFMFPALMTEELTWLPLKNLHSCFAAGCCDAESLPPDGNVILNVKLPGL